MNIKFSTGDNVVYRTKRGDNLTITFAVVETFYRTCRHERVRIAWFEANAKGVVYRKNADIMASKIKRVDLYTIEAYKKIGEHVKAINQLNLEIEEINERMIMLNKKNENYVEVQKEVCEKEKEVYSK